MEKTGLYWTSNFDIDGNRLEVPIKRDIADLDVDHIVNIYKWQAHHNAILPEKYRRYFRERLEEAGRFKEVEEIEKSMASFENDLEANSYYHLISQK